MYLNRLTVWTLWLVLVALASPLHATEYFVATDGDDANDGRSRADAFRTVQKGIDALAAGDTLIIAPGEYREAVSHEGLGSEDVVTTIRARIPGTVLLRGDEPAPSFEPVPGHRFVYAADFPRQPQAVNEADTLRVLESAPNIAELSFSPGKFHYDAEAQRLYISPSDLQPPQTHHYTVSTVAGRAGLFLREAQRVVVDGLAATGFHNRVELDRLRGGNFSDRIAWGFYLSQCRQTVIRNCTAYLNAGGIGAQTAWRADQGRGNVFEDCLAYANHSSLGESFGNLIIVNPSQDTIRDSVARISNNHGIRTHGTSEVTGVHFENNLSWGHGAANFQIKSYSGADRLETTRVHRVITPEKTINAPVVAHSILSRHTSGEPHDSNIYLEDEPDLDMQAEFADPVNHDYRLQATSRFRGSGPDGSDKGPFPYEPNIFYLSPDGNDANDGLSTAAPWQSLEHALANLEAGDTLYLTAGTYQSNHPVTLTGSAEAPITLRARGKQTVIIQGPLQLRNSAGLRVERLNFTDPVKVESTEDVRFKNCRFQGAPVALDASAVPRLRLTHSVFTGFTKIGLRLRDSAEAFIRGNIFDNENAPAIDLDDTGNIAYSDYNSYRAADGAWRVSGRARNLDALTRHETHSRVITPHFEQREGLARLANANAFAARGPLGHALGTYRPDDRAELPLRMTDPVVHSTTATTANIEWWSSHPETFEVHWGPTPACENSETLSPINPYHPHGTHLNPYHTYSLTGLEPNTTYYVRIDHGDTQRGPMELTTASRPHEPRTLHVSGDGDDTNDGLNRGSAFRSLNHAASQARPGDTVMVAGGTYHERVRVRTTGTAEAPITFRAAPGEKVVFDGHERSLHTAFSVFNKAHIHIDGFYFQDFNRVWTRGLINVVRSNDVAITRCFADARLPGTNPELVTAGGAENMLIKNCVINGGWGGIAVGEPKGLRFENNVILRSSITPIGIGGSAENLVIRDNIISDNLAKKRFAALAPRRDAITLANNCFYLRWPETERSVFGDNGPLLNAYEQQAGVEQGNLTVDPRFAVFAHAPTNGNGDGNGEEPIDTEFFTDQVHREIGDFPDAFATNPTLIERGIGLEREAFADFHFNASEAEPE